MRWIELFFKPKGEKFNYEVGRFEFNAHGEAAKGQNEGPVHACPVVQTSVKITKAGTLFAAAYCNIHDLWEASKNISLE